AQTELKFLPKKSSMFLLKLLNSAVANAKHNFSLDRENLYIARIFVDGGPILKRMRPRAFGHSAGINKRTSHITIVLDEITPGKEKTKQKQGKKSAAVKKEKSKTEKTESEEGVDGAAVSEAGAEETGGKKHSLQSVIRESKKTRSNKPKEFMKKVFRRKVI
ncbi:50S ribosomal protein L22, partial [Patescibacteria group bacterium]|nr:50S ribosomal protein L22 [Patescibacteria group bacterium]